ncbi:V-type ATP synthase subunit D [Thermotoga sp.]|nr:V-type ATP synthase subunit D [Thermotoga sp.]MCD6551646.1 hypothetical protein [Thermotoga sp.]
MSGVQRGSQREIKYIQDTLEELKREEFLRLKRLKERVTRWGRTLRETH